MKSVKFKKSNKRRIPLLPLISPLFVLCFLVGVENNPSNLNSSENDSMFLTMNFILGDGTNSFLGWSIKAAQQAKTEEGGCTEELLARVEAATSANAAEYAMVAGVASQGVQQTQKEGGAATGYYAAAGINAVTGLVSGSKYIECDAAVSECEAACAEPVLPRQEQEAERKRILKSCVSKRGACSSMGLQSALSLAQAGLNYLAGKNLDGDEPPPKPPGKEIISPTPPDPNRRAGGGPGSGLTTSAVPRGDAPPKVGGAPMPFPMLPTTEGKPEPSPTPLGPADRKPGPGGLPTPGPLAERDPSPEVGGSPGNSGSKGSSPASTLSGNPMGGKSPHSRNRAPKKVRPLKKEGNRDQLVVAGGVDSGGSFGSDAIIGGGLALGSGRRGGWRGKKTASNKKKSDASTLIEKKRSLAQNSFGQHDSIFKKASALINNYCNGGSWQCE